MQFSFSVPARLMLAIIFLCLVKGNAPLFAQGQPEGDYHRAVTVEDFSSLTLETSKLAPEKPVLGEKNDFGKFSRELIQVKWRAGDPIDLYIIKPTGVAKPPVALYLYSYPTETDRFRDDGFCERVTRDGVAAVGFVSALTGHRYANRPMKEWFVSEMQESLAASVHDVQMILNFLQTRNDLDVSNVGIFGAGSGATIAILSASVDHRLKAIDLLDPWGDWPDWMAKSPLIPDEERPNYVKPEFLSKIAAFDPVRVLPTLKSQHIRMEQVMDDEVTPKVAKEKLQAAAPAEATVTSWDDTKQFFAYIGGGKLFRWLDEQLKPETAATSPNAKKAVAPKSEGGDGN